jgi:hypothetical protein
MSKTEAREIPKQRNVSYQYQLRKCGRATCQRCRTGERHGPYWYAYWREGKTVYSAYIGRVMPTHLRRGFQFAQEA